MWWRSHPRVASVVALGLFLAALAVGGGWFPDTGSRALLRSASPCSRSAGRDARPGWWPCARWPTWCRSTTSPRCGSWVAALMFTVPPYAAGTVLRLRKETADQLALRAQELEDERELFAEIALRHERARIASELHDIVGHAISVMVIQAAAGQRLVDADPARAKEAFAAISESARQGTKDLERLIELLGGSDGDEGGGPDLSLVDEVVTRAGRSGLNVTCRFEGDRDRVPQPVAHLAFRVVQESLTNALRYAPGAERPHRDQRRRGRARPRRARRERPRAPQTTRPSPAPGAAWSACASASRRSADSSARGPPASAGGRSRRGSQAPSERRSAPPARPGATGAEQRQSAGQPRAGRRPRPACARAHRSSA